MAFRNSKFWYSLQFKADRVVFPFDKEELDVDGSLDNDVEKRSCCKLVVVGPLFDGYIGQIARSLNKRLRHGKSTGIVESQLIYFPYSIFIQFVKMVKGYGGRFSLQKSKKGDVQKFIVIIDKEVTSRKIFHPET